MDNAPGAAVSTANAYDAIKAYGEAKKAAARPAPPIGAGLATPPADGDSAYGIAALHGECDALAAMPPDTGRNSALNTAAFKLSQLVAAGHLTHQTMRINLEGAARMSGLAQHEIDLVLRDGANGALAVGAQAPRNVPELPERPGLTEWTPPALAGAHDPAQADPDAPTTPDVPEHTSWWFRDLEGVLNGTVVEEPPVHLARTDGHRLFYAAKVNGLIGESESGKTWVALLAVLQAIQVGEQVLYLDFEDSASGIIARLRALGATEMDLARFAYVDPDETLHLAAKEDLAAVLDTHQPALIVLDGFNAAMTLLGLDLLSNTDATTFSQTVLKRLARTGATIIYIDHLPKNRETQTKGGIGAQAKRAMTTGCAIKVEIAQEFGRGMTGRLKLTVDKDRAGHVRAISAGAKNAGTAVLISSPDGTRMEMHIDGPDLRPADERGPFRPTTLMERVSVWLEERPAGGSTTTIKAEVTGQATAIGAALDRLVEEGHVTRTPIMRGGHHHISTSPFRGDEHPTPSPRPTPSQPRPATGSKALNNPVAPSRPLGRDGDGVRDGHPGHPQPRRDQEDPWDQADDQPRERYP